MTSRICYRPRGSVADISDYTLGGRELIISVSGYEVGHLTLGNLTFPLEGGEVRLPGNRLSDGEYHPILTVGGSQIRLERFEISGGKLALLPTEEWRIRELLHRVRELEERLKLVEERLSAQEKKISSETIF